MSGPSSEPNGKGMRPTSALKESLLNICWRSAERMEADERKGGEGLFNGDAMASPFSCVLFSPAVDPCSRRFISPSIALS